MEQGISASKICRLRSTAVFLRTVMMLHGHFSPLFSFFDGLLKLKGTQGDGRSLARPLISLDS